MQKKPNVILITIDALRADHLGYMGYKKNTSPNIDVLAKESAVFTNAYSNGPITPHSFPSILTSTYPLDYQGPKKIERPRILISEVLQKAGYITAAFHSNPYLSNYFGYDKGWDFFEDISMSEPLFSPPNERKRTFLGKHVREILISTCPKIFFWIKYLGYRYKKSKFKIPWVKAGPLTKILKDFVDSVRSKKQPFFLWVHYMDVHHPYLSQDTFLHENPFSYLEYTSNELPYYTSSHFRKRTMKRFIQKYLPISNNFYDQGIKYVDRFLGNLLTFLKEKDVYDNSVIFLTADHGDEFFEHGEGFHLPKLYNELLHVPLLVKIPDSQPRKIETKVSLIDLSPTICNILRIEKPSSFKGKSLFELKNGPIFHQTAFNSKKKKMLLGLVEINRIDQCKVACQHQGWKYILNHGTNTEELYNLSSDPEEQNNLSQREASVLLKMRNLIQDFERKNPPLSLIGKN